MSYTPTPGEAGSTVTVVYQVCNTDPDPDVCATATITISVTDTPCNTPSAWTNATYTNLTASIVDDVPSGIPLCLGGIFDVDNVADTDPDNFATVTITGTNCNGTIGVRDGDTADTYPAGYFAGFEVSTAGLFTSSLSATVTIETYNDGSLTETFDAVTTTVGINSSLINADGNIVLGFVSSTPFDEIRITYQTLGAALFTAQVYHAVIERFCAGSALACNVQTLMNNPDYPTIIDPAETGLSGLACAGCSVTNAENVISDDATDFATIALDAALGTVGAIAVQDVLTDYPAGSFAGFNISNPDLIEANLFSGLSLSTYLDGVLQETSSPATLFSSASTSLLNGSGEQLIGMITSLPFDEVKIEVENLLGVSSVTRVYSAVFETFCVGPALDCASDTYLTTPSYPVIVDNSLTGISGAVCGACSINNPQNVIDSDISNVASIDLAAGFLSTGSIAIWDVLTDYPAGTFAGFDIDNSVLIGVNLFGATEITTYLDGVEQENSGSSLISLGFSIGTRQVVGFTTTLPFDEVRLSVSNLAALNIGSTLVYGAVLRSASNAGVEAPVLTGDIGSGVSVSNSCPATTFDLNSLVASTPAGADLVWFTTNDNPPTGMAYATPTTAEAGIYYAYYYDSVADCYSLASNSVTVNITACDSDGDGVTDEQEGLDGTDPNDPCSLVLTSVSQNATSMGDCDGDGVTNADEINGTDGDFSTPDDNTDPNDPCDFNAGDVSQNATSAGDCDGDGVTNADEINGLDDDFSTPGDNTDPLDPCDFNEADISQNATSMGDCDGDGVTNADEINGLDDDFSTPGDNTDPLDPCDYNPADQGTPDPAWNAADCDEDGNPNSGDPDPLSPNASDDNLSAPNGMTSAVNILANDDFLPNNDPNNLGTTTLSDLGTGTAAGTVVFDPLTGEMTYTPTPGEAGATVTVDYQVCNTDPDPDVCATATVTIIVTGCTINTFVWLEGAYDSNLGEMRTDLNDQGLLPGQDPVFFLGTETPVGQPYSAAPWNYNGAEGDSFDYTAVGDAKAGYDPDVVDWVLVSLRTGTDANTSICRQAGLVYKDGSVVFPDGCNCSLTNGQEVYIVIEHRNHLPVMSADPVVVTANAEVNFDFRSQQSFIMFVGDGQKLLSAGIYGMFASNGDQISGGGSRVDINADDESVWTANNGMGDAYNQGDYNLDGDVNANDESIWLENTGKSSDVNFN